ncbi:MotA/TolQ/ExbB proton channel family protein [Aquibacillus koreensis]|uniref:MotA/TolQ/ExbB proton channel family protein n=1 Tax=Aquibacillus koreensis TaxID=279446 RepID=A0A9X3WN81_9BACI|nr:MotA/TolQ/ExbB proton channel family protein [Aquibacillus koreensis]MCT2536919.1 MotA/TolQ/ExbB proton channel family protein [Aquibacillus koreensis]MDC3421950.1 MotA/TolQ/ExbB proton channel family protein [Aquibacillus koreensis]
MVEGILKFFVNEQKAEAIISNELIEVIFAVLFVSFFIALIIHLTLFLRLRRVRNHLRETDQLDIEPVKGIKEEFYRRQQEEQVKVETFVQEKFSGWRIFGVPSISLIKMVQATVSVFILIGVLGTFIGLTMSLGSISASGDQLVEDVASVLAGIDIAFYTSIAGMGLSLIMTLLIKGFNTEYLMTDIMLKVESCLEEYDENGMGNLIKASEAINQSILSLQETNQQSLQSIVEHFSGFKDYTKGLQKSAEDLAKFNDGLAQNLHDFQVLFDSMHGMTEGLNKATVKLNKNFDQLFTYFKKMDDRNERMATTFEQTYQRIKEVSTAQIENLSHFEETTTDLKDFTSSILDAQVSVKESMENINRKNKELVKGLEDHNREFKRIFGGDLSVKLEGITTYLRELSTDFDKLGDSVVHLPAALDTIHQAQMNYKELLTDRFDELKQFNKDFHNHLKGHAADSMAFEKHLLEATNTYEQVGRKNNELIHDINNTIAQMNQSFNQRENQLESNLNLLKDTLSKYVTNLEGTLGDRLEKVVRNIGEYVDMTNQSIKKEFMELRLITEDIQQSNQRQTQQTIGELNQEIYKLNKHLHDFSQEAMRLNTGRGMNRDD